MCFQGTLSILEEESHIKDVLSRIIVEMIKREWPQHWPDMLKEMEVLTSQGVSNLYDKEMVYSFLRLFGISLPHEIIMLPWQ